MTFLLAPSLMHMSSLNQMPFEHFFLEEKKQLNSSSYLYLYLFWMHCIPFILNYLFTCDKNFNCKVWFLYLLYISYVWFLFWGCYPFSLIYFNIPELTALWWHIHLNVMTNTRYEPIFLVIGFKNTDHFPDNPMVISLRVNACIRLLLLIERHFRAKASNHASQLHVSKAQK